MPTPRPVPSCTPGRALNATPKPSTARPSVSSAPISIGSDWGEEATEEESSADESLEEEEAEEEIQEEQETLPDEANPAEPFDVSSLKAVDDQKAPRPQAGKPQLSKSAMQSRLRRLMAPSVRGTFRVSQEVLKQYHDPDGKKSLEMIFQMVGFDRDRGPTKCVCVC